MTCNTVLILITLVLLGLYIGISVITVLLLVLHLTTSQIKKKILSSILLSLLLRDTLRISIFLRLLHFLDSSILCIRRISSKVMSSRIAQQMHFLITISIRFSRTALLAPITQSRPFMKSSVLQFLEKLLLITISIRLLELL